MHVRKLTDGGIEKFRKFIDDRRGEDKIYSSKELLAMLEVYHEEPLSEPFEKDIKIEKNKFNTKYELAKYFSEKFRDVPSEYIAYNRHLWTWLSIFYLDELLANKIGRRKGKFNQPNNYILEVDDKGKLIWKDYSYHLLATPYYLYRQHSDVVKILLNFPSGSKSEFMHETVSRQQFTNSRTFMKLINKLYNDGNDNTKPRSLGLHKPGPGTLLRLITVIRQLEKNYDVFHMPPDKLLSLLPSEFHRWYRR